ncbi:MAG: PKD domain-containing protein [Patescibacteria group bacterium]|nr:PKD domain-containing protein [Patescibacteria group bacterium]
MSLFSGKKILLLGFILVLLGAIPVTLYLLQRQQEIRSSAAPLTVVSFKPDSTLASPIQKNVGDKADMDIMMDPGKNIITVVKLYIKYDPKKLAVIQNGFVPNSAVVTALEGPTYNSGSVYALLSVIVSSSQGADPTKVIQSATKLGTISFNAIEATDAPTEISYTPQTQARSSAAGDPYTENSIKNTIPAYIKIGGVVPTPTIQPSITATPSATNQSPVCTSFALDREASGTAPLSITFTASGNDPDSTINKATFNFGDGPVQDVTQAGGIGTNNVSVQIAHTFNNSGTFNTSAVLTDDKGAVSDIATCSKTITISGGSATGGTTRPAATATPTTVVTTPQAPGPGDIILGAGAFGIAATIIGALVFLAL